MERLTTAWAIFQGLLLEALPFLLLGVTIASLARWLALRRSGENRPDPAAAAHATWIDADSLELRRLGPPVREVCWLPSG